MINLIIYSNVALYEWELMKKLFEVNYPSAIDLLEPIRMAFA